MAKRSGWLHAVPLIVVLSLWVLWAVVSVHRASKADEANAKKAYEIGRQVAESCSP